MASVSRLIVATVVLAAVCLGIWHYLRPVEAARHQRVRVLESDHLGKRFAALTPSGAVWDWEIRRKPGTLADEITTARELPGLRNVASVSVGACSIVAVKSDGTVWGQGCNAAGQLGPMSSDDRGVITQWSQAIGLPKIRRVVATGVTALAVADDGSVWAWGSNHDGFMGEKIKERSLRRPVRLEALSDIVDITSGGGFSSGTGNGFYAVRRDGTVWVWGRRYLFGMPHVEGQSETIPYTEPLRVETLTDVRQVIVDRTVGMPALAIHFDGRVTLWGRNLGWCNDREPPPYQIPGLDDVTSAAVGVDTVLAVRRDGSLWHWGWTDPQPGVSARCMDAAQQLLPPGSVKEVVAGSLLRTLLLQDGSVRIWGVQRGQFDRTPLPERAPIAQLPKL